MKAIKLTFAIGIVLVSTSPAFSSFVKAALGFRLGYSPTEQGYGKPYSLSADKKGVGVQVLSGVNNGGWQNGGGLKASGSGYGVGIGGGGQGRSLGGGPLDAHVGHGAVKHLRILGLNLYLGGRAALGGHGGYNKPPLVKKPIYGLAHQYQQHHPQQHHPQHHPQQGYLSGIEALAKPVSLGASVGAGLKPVIAHAPNGGKVIGGAGGVRAGVGTPGFGLGFNLGYKQGINTKSPLGYLFGLGGHGKGHHYYSSPIQKGPIYKGQDQVYIPGNGLLKGHGHDISHAPSAGIAQNSLYGAFPQGFESQFAGLESKHHYSTQPAHPQQHQQNQQQQHSQASQQQSQQARTPQKHHQGLQGPLALPSSYPRNPFLAFFQGRPSILRPTPYQYSFNSPQSLPSGPIRMVLSPHPPTPAPQRPRSAFPNESPSWSTLFSLGGPRPAASNFVNPLPPNGQPLTKLQASLRHGNQFQRHPQNSPLTSAQNQLPFVHQAGHEHAPPQQYQGYFPQALQSPGQFAQPLHLQQPQHNNFQQYFSSGFQQQHQPSAHPQQQQQQIPQDFSSIFQQSSLQSSYQNLPQHNFQHSPLVSPQQSPFFSNIQEQPTQTAASPNAQSKQSENFPSIPELPFTADSMQFNPEPGFQYSHSTVSEPVKMGDFTMHMDLSNNNNNNNNGVAGGEQSQSGSEVPMFGPMGRRLKKTKKSRQDSIIKKQGSAEAEVSNKINHDMMETSASTNSMTLTSSLGSTSWTPIKMIDAPKLEKKSLDTAPVSTTLQVVDKRPIVQPPPPQPKQQQIQQQQQQQTPSFSPSSPTGIGSSAILTGPAPALGPQDKPDRTMILKKRRLSLSSGEVLNLIPGMNPPALPSGILPTTTTTTTSQAPSSTTSASTTTTSTTTTTVVPPPSSTSSAPSSSSSSSVAPSTTLSTDIGSTSQSPVTTTAVI